MNKRTTLFIVLAIVSVASIPWIHIIIIKLGAMLYKISAPFVTVCLFGPLVFVLGNMQCLAVGKNSPGFRSGMWYMVAGTIMITFALSYAFYGVTPR